MDTKPLYIKTQRNIQNWGITLSGILFILSILPLVVKNKNIAKNNLDVWVNFLCYTLVFLSLLYSRVRNNVKMSLTALLVYLSLFAYYLITFTLNAKLNYESFKNLNIPNPMMAMVLGYGSTLLIMTGFSYLYYKVFLASKNIKILSEMNH